MPSAFRNPKNLPEWLELDFFRRPRPLRQWKLLLTWTMLGVLTTAAAAAFFVPRSTRWLQAGPVSPAHTFINGECAQCHTDALQTPKRFLRWGDTVRAVPNDACSRCHQGPPHNDRQLIELDCASCHREHRGRPTLARVPDSNCTACHADLKSNHVAGEGCPFEDVAHFPDGHPEFALWRGRDPKAPNSRDPGQLLFNHAVHLAPEGLLQPDGSKKAMACGNCHDVDDAGRYMRPIDYEQDCKACHALSVRLTGRFDDAKSREAAEKFARVPAPHREPAVVRALLRDRLLDFVRENQLVAGVDEGLNRFVPKLGRAQAITEQQWTWARRELREMEKALFATTELPEQERALFRLSGGCTYCHVLDQDASNRAFLQDGLPQLLATNLRGRWLPHSRFRHTAHRMLKCTECHDAESSTATADVLMPRLETCARCHNDAVGARHDCVECHQYHHRGHAMEPTRTRSADD